MLYKKYNKKGFQLKTIVIGGFKGGVGKSTVSNNVAERLENSLIVNLDFYQDAVEVNTARTINLGKNESLSEYMKTLTNVEYVIVDAGGFDDARIYDINVDLFIFPLTPGYRSIKATVDSSYTILSQYKYLKNVMYIINKFKDDKDFEKSQKILEEILQKSEIPFDNIFLNGIKDSNATQTVENEKLSLESLRSKNSLSKRSYGMIDDVYKDLAKEIMKIGV